MDTTATDAEANAIVDVAKRQNVHSGMPPWLAGLQLGVVAIKLLGFILIELRKANAKRKMPTDA